MDYQEKGYGVCVKKTVYYQLDTVYQMTNVDWKMSKKPKTLKKKEEITL